MDPQFAQMLMQRLSQQGQPQMPQGMAAPEMQNRSGGGMPPGLMQVLQQMLQARGAGQPNQGMGVTPSAMGASAMPSGMGGQGAPGLGQLLQLAAMGQGGQTAPQPPPRQPGATMLAGLNGAGQPGQPDVGMLLQRIMGANGPQPDQGGLMGMIGQMPNVANEPTGMPGGLPGGHIPGMESMMPRLPGAMSLAARGPLSPSPDTAGGGGVFTPQRAPIPVGVGEFSSPHLYQKEFGSSEGYPEYA